MSLPGVLIASRISPTAVGGLAGYQRGLGAELESRSLARVEYFCDEIAAEPKLWMNLASRPWTHGLLEKLIVRHYFRTLALRRRQRYAAVHFVGTGWDFVGFALHALARDTGAKFTIWPAVHPGQWGDDRIDLRLFNKADAVMCQSDSEAVHLQTRGLDPAKVVRCGLPPMCGHEGNGPRLRKKLDLGRRPVVLFLGRKDEGKGYPALLRAWPKVLAVHPQAVVLLAGPGGEEYAAALHALPADSFRDLGIPQEIDKTGALAACDVFCLPSAHESFGIVYVEAWSYGKPVICGPAAASRELVHNGETGLWAGQTPESIARTVIEFLNNPAARQRMRKRPRNSRQQRPSKNRLLDENHIALVDKESLRLRGERVEAHPHDLALDFPAHHHLFQVPDIGISPRRGDGFGQGNVLLRRNDVTSRSLHLTPHRVAARRVRQHGHADLRIDQIFFIQKLRDFVRGHLHTFPQHGDPPDQAHGNGPVPLDALPGRHDRFLKDIHLHDVPHPQQISLAGLGQIQIKVNLRGGRAARGHEDHHRTEGGKDCGQPQIGPDGRTK